MSLAPEERVLLTDALRPPAGYRVDIAVGTTYSIDLTALLLAPLSFAVFDETASDDVASADPVRLLEAVRRHAEHTTVFCQAGSIHVPGAYRSILTFVEDSVLEVMPPQWAGLFHPKVWALRFAGQEGRRLHRVVVLSRNLTFDKSWDTALTLDEADDGTVSAAPAADFVQALPHLAVRQPLSPERLAQMHDLARTLRSVQLAVPAPYREGELLPIGLTADPVWPFPDNARRLLAISPFLTKPALHALAKISDRRTLVSRAESLDLVGSRALENWDVNVLQRLAEIDPGADADGAPVALGEFVGTAEGLHAKSFVLDLKGGESLTITGSNNLTSHPWGGSVEFDAVLRGPTSSCGVAAVLDGKPEAPGLTSLLQEHSVADQDGVEDAAIATSYALEDFHRLLAASLPSVHVSRLDEERVELTVSLTVPDNAPGTTTVWPSSLPADAHRQALAETLMWTIAPANVTPFVAIETTAGEGPARITRRCVLKAALSSDVDGRRQDAVFSILRNKADVLRYLVFLLGDPSYDALFAQFAGVDAERHFSSAGAGSADVALFEPLVRATGRDEDALARVASLVEELRSADVGQDLVPDGFDELWDVVWQVHQERRR